MRQRPQYLLAAFATAGHPVYFIDPREPEERRAEGVRIVNGVDRVPKRGVILYVHFAPMRHMFSLFDQPAVVYDLLDDLSIYEPDEIGLPAERRVASHHPHVMGSADVVLVSNRVLAERHSSERPDLLLVPNGVDPGRFGKLAERPPDLPDPDPDRPIIGYHGAVSLWFDFDLLERVARLRPAWRFVLVGPVDDRVADRAAALGKFPNIRLLGEKSSDDMPGYVQGFDVGTIWFQVNEMTLGVTPLKMYEYLAAGVPCVATPLPACVDEPEVATAADPDRFIADVEAALASGRDPAGAAARRAAARQHSWDAHLSPVLGKLRELGLDRVP